jgi:hypothetical protein
MRPLRVGQKVGRRRLIVYNSADLALMPVMEMNWPSPEPEKSRQFAQDMGTNSPIAGLARSQFRLTWGVLRMA